MTAHSPLKGPSVWLGNEIENDPRWRYHLSGSHIAEIDAALAGVRQAGLAWYDLTIHSFPLPNLKDLLADIGQELEQGVGFALLRGLPIERYDEAQRRALWYGMGCHLGQPVHQDCHGLLMRDITDAQQDTDSVFGHHLQTRDGQAFASSKARTLSNGPLRFHTDRTDVVALLCAATSSSGGASRIASSPAVHNQILAERPDLLEVLFAPYQRSRLGEEIGGENMTYPLPVFGIQDGYFTSHYSRTYIEAAEEMDGVAKLTIEQVEAIEMLHDAADALCFGMQLEAGDMQFLNSHVTYHARDAFEDNPGQNAPGRCLHRLWLTTPNNRPLPEDHKILWRSVKAGTPRGGITLK